MAYVIIMVQGRIKKMKLRKAYKKNRKAVLYTGIAGVILIILFIVFYYTIYQEKTSEIESKNEILFINRFASLLDKDLPKAVEISVRRSFLALEDYCSLHATFVKDSETLLKEAMLNGTINNETYPIIINDSLGVYINNVKKSAASRGLNLEINITKISLYHTSPWNINTEVYLTINISSRSDNIEIVYNKTVNVSVSIIGLRDPLYSVNTNGRLHNAIYIFNKSPIINNSNNTQDFLNFSQEMYYISNPDAPSFLQRFEGNLSPSAFGIESIVNLEEFAAQGIEIKQNSSVIDHIYFSNQTNTADWCNFEDMPSWIKVDIEHGNFYGLNNINHTSCS